MTNQSNSTVCDSEPSDRPPALWIKNPRAIYTANQLDATNGIVVQGDRILEVVSKGTQPSAHIDQVFHAGEHVLLPGLVNTHLHFYQTLTRAFPSALNKRLFPWLQTLYPVWAGLTPEMMKTATELAMVEWLYHSERPSLSVSGKSDRRH